MMKTPATTTIPMNSSPKNPSLIYDCSCPADSDPVDASRGCNLGGKEGHMPKERGTSPVLAATRLTFLAHLHSLRGIRCSSSKRQKTLLSVARKRPLPRGWAGTRLGGLLAPLGLRQSCCFLLSRGLGDVT